MDATLRVIEELTVLEEGKKQSPRKPGIWLGQGMVLILAAWAFVAVFSKKEQLEQHYLSADDRKQLLFGRIASGNLSIPRFNFASLQFNRTNLSNLDLRNGLLSGTRLFLTTATNTDFSHSTGKKWEAEASDLRSSNFAKTRLTNAVFFSSKLDGADFKDSRLVSGSFSKSKFRSARFDGALLQSMSVREASFVESSFLRSRIKSVTFESCDFSQADFSQAIMTNIAFHSCNLAGAKLTGADIRGVNLMSASGLQPEQVKTAKNWRLAIHGADMRRQLDLPDDYLRGCDLNFVEFGAGEIGDLDLSRANLANAGFSKASLRNANLQAADLQRARFYKVDFSRANLIGANLKWASLQQANFSDADLSGADLSGDQHGWFAAVFRGARLANVRWYDKNPQDRPAHRTPHYHFARNVAACDFRGAVDLDLADISLAAKWFLARYDPEFVEKFGMPENFWQQQTNKNSNLSIDLSGRDLSGFNWQWVNLRGANLRNCSFRNAPLDNADLTGADLRGADLSGVSLNHTQFEGVDLQGIKFDKAFSSPARISKAKNISPELRATIERSRDPHR